jgi:hypothetical protein
MKEMILFMFTVTHWQRTGSIRSAAYEIVAENKDEAWSIFHNEAHKFLDQDSNVSVEELYHGYQQ